MSLIRVPLAIQVSWLYRKFRGQGFSPLREGNDGFDQDLMQGLPIAAVLENVA